MKTDCIFVNTKESCYPIYIGVNLLKDEILLRQYIKNCRIMIVTNGIVAPLYLTPLKVVFHDLQCEHYLLPDGEQFKNIRYWKKILNMLIIGNYPRDSTLIALGGGIVGDLTGFVAACYQRGIDFVQLPTTLLAQVDASIGGKTAINHPYGKNLIGTFHHPKAVVIDLHTLHTLPSREFNSGISEIVKSALICDKGFFIDLEKNITYLLRRDLSYLQIVVKRACKIKIDIINSDEKEKTGIRTLLNLGHTFGHAIEHLFGYGYWLHGEAVALGLVLSAQLSCYLGIIESYEVMRICELLQRIPLPTQLPKGIFRYSLDSLLISMRRDKKMTKYRIRLVLLERIGHAIISDQIDENVLRAFFINLSRT
ncbi:3-dehydroquinate synthase [Coxiella endosymbiont of Amblyomma sculptum]|uniref:3-dehydroquinate synthase n=1 Tax=Coxiella endosymbiont of Amblyomma sculptum TaxID=2487929 RepID=UPI00132EBFEE|nr:3-dehydroquinate synthase [Coxiella endosymbiont of Amblyomma sculptum]QHG92217.1 3-dehydroquinate synthase [Coxiella endosymbiont of Amblyomma sculptum]